VGFSNTAITWLICRTTTEKFFAVSRPAMNPRRQGRIRENGRARRVAKHNYPKFEVGLLLDGTKGGIMNLLASILGLVTSLTGSVGGLLGTVGNTIGSVLGTVGSAL
jgi:hypothetical protein